MYLYGDSFEVHTDNNPHSYILITAKLDVTGLNCMASLANYNFRLYYKTGKSNVETEALSGIPWVRVID